MSPRCLQPVASRAAGIPISLQFQILRDRNGGPADLKQSPFFHASFGYRGEPGELSHCSHTWVSNKGHVLTAFHCIRSCIEAAKFEMITRQD